MTDLQQRTIDAIYDWMDSPEGFGRKLAFDWLIADLRAKPKQEFHKEEASEIADLTETANAQAIEIDGKDREIASLTRQLSLAAEDSQAEIDRLTAEIDRLGCHLLKNFPAEIAGGSAVDVAIRLLAPKAEPPDVATDQPPDMGNPISEPAATEMPLNGTTHDNVLALIGQGVNVVPAMAAKLLLSRGRISQVCGDLLHKGLIVRHDTKDGKPLVWWSLACQSEEPEPKPSKETQPPKPSKETKPAPNPAPTPVNGMAQAEADRIVAFIRCAAAGGSVDDCEASTGFTPEEIYNLLQRFEHDIKLVAGFKSPMTVQAYLDLARRELMELGHLRREKVVTS